MVKIEQKILFKLNNGKAEVTLPDLLGMGHARAHVIALFETLEGEGAGEYRHGSKGRGQYSRFLKNDSCPTEYVLVLEEKPRGRRRKNSTVETVTVANIPNEPELDSLAQNINSNELMESSDAVAASSDDIEDDDEISIEAIQNAIASNDEDLHELMAIDDIPTQLTDADLTGVVADMTVSRNNTNSVDDADDESDDLAARAEAAISA